MRRQKLIVECEVKSSCVFLKSKVERRLMLKLRGGTVAFQIEMGRWHGLKVSQSHGVRRSGCGQV